MINIKTIPADAAGTEHFPKGSVIIEDGDRRCGKMYIITKGHCYVLKNYKQQGEIKMADLYAGDFFGEMSLFMGKGRTATVVAASDVSVVALDHVNARDFFRNHPDATFSLIRDLCGRLVKTSSNMASNAVKYEQDLTVLNNKNAELQIAANIDPLTKVFNRRYFMEKTPQMIQNAAQAGKQAFIIIVDLDFFKKVNDTYGHQAGDETLRTMAAVACNTLRESDLFARYGGEEFIICVITSDLEDAKAVVEHVRLNIESTTIIFEDLRINVTASFGVSPISDPNGVEAAIARADEALYTAKESGRNRYVVAAQ